MTRTPQPARRLTMIIDLTRCIGCHTCAVACKVENNLPDGIWWNRVKTIGGPAPDTPSGGYPDVRMASITIACQHCEDPPCVSVCPTGATFKRASDGIVLVDYELCIGCGACVQACPYDGVRTRNASNLSYASGHPMGGAGVQPQQPGTVTKCTFCVHRVDQGLTPACIDVCPTRARFFGDAADPDSEVSKILAERTTMRLRPEQGTQPNVHFIVDEPTSDQTFG